MTPCFPIGGIGSNTTLWRSRHRPSTPVIEAQQEMIDAALTAVDPVILAIDVGPVRYKQILQKLIQAEQRQ